MITADEQTVGTSPEAARIHRLSEALLDAERGVRILRSIAWGPAAMAERPDCIELLFCGKLDIEDIPAVGQMAEKGLCVPPRFLPPWVSDMRFLLSYLAYSSFLNQIDLHQVRARIDGWLTETPAAPWSCTWLPNDGADPDHA